MKSNSYNQATALALVTAVTALVIASWPTTGRSQDSSRRDRERYRREIMSRTSSGRPESGRPENPTQSGRTRSDPGRRDASIQQPGSSKQQTAPAGTSEKTGRITKAAEPNAALQPVERRPPRRVVQDQRWTQYEIVTQRNMFSRQRVPLRVQTERAEERPRTIPNPESYLLLKGIVQEDNQFIAFVEDKQSGNVLRLRQGDQVARGTIKSLNNLDGLEYQFQDKTISVSLGFDLEGGHGAVTAGDLASFVPTTAPATSGTSAGTPALPAADEAEILKRLMEQRKQQMGQ